MHFPRKIRSPHHNTKVIIESSPNLKLKLRGSDLDRLTKIILERVSESFPQLKGKTVYIFLVGRKLFRKLREEYIGQALDSDVLTLTYDTPQGEDVLLGEIYVNVDRVFKNALKYRRGVLEELAFVVAHGFLHLLGFTDENEEKREEMFAIQHKLIEGIFKG